MKLKYGLVLTTGWAKDRLIAVITDGSPQMGHAEVTILDLKPVDDEEEANVWFEEMKILRPWEARQ